MSNDTHGSGGSSIWPVITIIVGIMTLGLAAWDVALGNANKRLEERVKVLESRAEKEDRQAKDAKAAAFKERQRVRAAAKAGGAEVKPKATTRRAPK